MPSARQASLFLAACAVLCASQVAHTRSLPPPPPAPPSPPPPPANGTDYLYKVLIEIPNGPFGPKLLGNESFVNSTLCPNLYTGIASSFYGLRFRPGIDATIEPTCYYSTKYRDGKLCTVTVGFELDLTEAAAAALVANFQDPLGFSVFVLGTLTPCDSTVELTWSGRPVLSITDKQSISLSHASIDCVHNLATLVPYL